MDNFYKKPITPEPEPVFKPYYSRHYITTDAQSRITAGWSYESNREWDANL